MRAIRFYNIDGEWVEFYRNNEEFLTIRTYDEGDFPRCIKLTNDDAEALFEFLRGIV